MTMELHANAGRNIEEAKKGIHQICEEIGRDNWRQHTKQMHPLGRIPAILRLVSCYYRLEEKFNTLI